jgi:hypothetical protein
MGGEYYYVTSIGASAQEAFNKAVADARYQHGHGGYTGTIAEKNEFIVLDDNYIFSKSQEIKDLYANFKSAVRGRADIASELDDWLGGSKWGPAWCIQIKDNTWAFFGWASS